MEQSAYFGLLILVYLGGMFISSIFMTYVKIKWLGEFTLTPLIMGLVWFVLYVVLCFYGDYGFLRAVSLITGILFSGWGVVVIWSRLKHGPGIW